MRDKLNQFISNLNGQFVEVSYKLAPYQCFDLAYTWVFALDIPKATIQHGSAFEIWSLASDLTREYFDLIPNKLETIPEEGDIVVWSHKYGNHGHVAIIIEATQTRMKVFEQNNPLGTNAHIQSRSYTNVSGFLRPKKGKNDEDKIADLLDKNKSLNEALARKALEYNECRDALETQERDNKDLAGQLLEARSERDKAVGEKKDMERKVEILEEEVKDAKKRTGILKKEKEGLSVDLVQSQERIIQDMTAWQALKLTILKFLRRG